MRYFIIGLSFFLMVSTVFADVIPTRVASKDTTETRTAVADRLETLGMSGDEAQAYANALPAEIASHYADSPLALQWVTGDEDEGPSPGEIATPSGPLPKADRSSD